MLLGLRREELGSIRWNDVDLDNRVLNIPDSKGGIPLTTPLSDRCCEILKPVSRFVDRDVLSDRASISSSTWSSAKAKLDSLCGVKDWRTHDLRRTMRSGPARLGTPVVVAKLCLGHKQGGVIGIYDRHTYLDERRAALLKCSL
jgi:integrase